MEDQDALRYECKSNHRGSHPETGGSLATMSDQAPKRELRRTAAGNISARKSILTGKDLRKILSHLGVSQVTFAKHTGLHSVTVRKYATGKYDGDIPLWIEWILWIYDELPWTRRIKGRISLPFRRWGLLRDDPDPAAQTHEDVLRAASSRSETWTRGSMIRHMERTLHEIINDPDVSDRSADLAKRAIQNLRRYAPAIDYEIGGPTRVFKPDREQHHEGDGASDD